MIEQALRKRVVYALHHGNFDEQSEREYQAANQLQQRVELEELERAAHNASGEEQIRLLRDFKALLATVTQAAGAFQRARERARGRERMRTNPHTSRRVRGGARTELSSMCGGCASPPCVGGLTPRFMRMQRWRRRRRRRRRKTKRVVILRVMLRVRTNPYTVRRVQGCASPPCVGGLTPRFMRMQRWRRTRTTSLTSTTT